MPDRRQGTIQRRLGGGLLGVAIAVLVAAHSLLSSVGDRLTRALGATMAEPLTERFRRVEIGDPETVRGIVVLGGGRQRLVEAGRLARQYPRLRVLVSGAGEPAEVWKALGAGIDPDRVLIETLSQTTYENAGNSRRFANPAGGERWLLVTSAIHMPRAVASFRKARFAVEPWPVSDFDLATGDVFSTARHEWTGLLAYWLLGRGQSLFPGRAER